MPAVTADTLTLPHLDPPAPGSLDRAVRTVTTAPHGFEGEGLRGLRQMMDEAGHDLSTMPKHPYEDLSNVV